MYNNWNDCDIITPSDKQTEENLLILAQEDFIVTGRLINKDPEDDDEVFVATWNYQDSTWRYTRDTSVRYGTKLAGWEIIAWQNFPNVYIKD